MVKYLDWIQKIITLNIKLIHSINLKHLGIVVSKCLYI